MYIAVIQDTRCKSYGQTPEGSILSSLSEELKAVAVQVGELLASDPFPSRVEPAHLREAVKSYPLRGGKRLRPAIAMWSCGALGGEPSLALKAGSAIEVYHNWTLVHDDIIDRDDMRRGVPTAHKTLERHGFDNLDMDADDAAGYGKSFAILAGDIQHAWAVDLLIRSVGDGVPAPLALALTRRLCDTVNRELISGEALDVEFPLRPEQPGEAEVLKMMSWKTGTLLKFCAQAGGAIALGDADFDGEPLTRLGDFAEKLGVAFQLMDDHLGVFGESKEFGKPLCSDMREGKPTLLLLKAFARLDEKGRARLSSLLRLPDYGRSEIDAVRGILRDCGAEAANKALAAKLSEESKRSLLLLPESRYRTLLLELADQLLGRQV